MYRAVKFSSDTKTVDYTLDDWTLMMMMMMMMCGQRLGFMSDN